MNKKVKVSPAFSKAAGGRGRGVPVAHELAPTEPAGETRAPEQSANGDKKNRAKPKKSQEKQRSVFFRTAAHIETFQHAALRRKSGGTAQRLPPNGGARRTFPARSLRSKPGKTAQRLFPDGGAHNRFPARSQVHSSTRPSSFRNTPLGCGSIVPHSAVNVN